MMKDQTSILGGEQESSSSDLMIIESYQVQTKTLSLAQTQQSIRLFDELSQQTIQNKKNTDSDLVVNLRKQRRQKKPKKVEYSIAHIPSQLYLKNSELFYMHGDILIDFQKKNSGLDDRYSLWNFCKVWPVSIINKTSRTLMLKLEQRITPSSSDKTISLQIQRYKAYPDQSIHALMGDIEKITSYNQWIGDYLINYFTQIMQQPMMYRQYFYLKDIFDVYMQGIYCQLQQEGAVFFATHSGPDFATFDYIFHRAIFSETFSYLLGKSLEELQYMYQKNGSYEFFDFESELIVGKMFLDEWLETIERFKTGNPPKKKGRRQIEKQMRLISFDDIYFYANVSLETYKMSDFYEDRSNPIDFYARIMYFDVSPSSIKQIITIRQQQQNDNSQTMIGDTLNHENLRYTLQAEMFKEKFIDTDNYNPQLDDNKIKQNENKTCKFRQL